MCLTPLTQLPGTVIEGTDVPPDDRRDARLSDSALAELEQATQKAVANGIREGLRSVITDDDYMEAFWSQGIKMAKQQATIKAGTLLMDSLTSIFKRAGQVFIVGLILYYLGGWEFTAKVLKFFFTGVK